MIRDHFFNTSFTLSLILGANFVFALYPANVDPMPLLHVESTPRTSEECPAIAHMRILKVNDKGQIHVKVLEILNSHTHLPGLIAGEEADIETYSGLAGRDNRAIATFKIGSEWVGFVVYRAYPRGKSLRMSPLQAIPVVNGIVKGKISDETEETLPLSELRQRVRDWARADFGFTSMEKPGHEGSKMSR